MATDNDDEPAIPASVTIEVSVAEVKFFKRIRQLRHGRHYFVVSVDEHGIYDATAVPLGKIERLRSNRVA